MEEKVYFKNSKGNKLCGILSKSTNDKSKPIIIFVHGFRSNKNTINFVKLKDFLIQKNITSFRFDIFSHGWSEGKFEELTISEAVDDIANAIKFLKKIGYTKFGLVGSSFGGNASITAASKLKDIVFLVLKSPVSNYEERTKKILTKKQISDWKKKGFREMRIDGEEYKLNYSFFEDFKNNNGYKVAPLIKVPTLIVHGNADESVPVEQSIKISKLIPNCKLVLIKGANHRYTKQEHAERMRKVISDFIINNI